MSKKKKVIVLSCMIALLAVTAVFNFVLTTAPGKTGDSTTVSAANYFSQYRQERLNTRNEELLQLDAIIASATSTGTDLSDALALKVKLTKITEKEMLLENLIKAYGYEDVVVIIGVDSDSVNVIAKMPDFTVDDGIIIGTIVSEENNIPSDNVKIIPIL